MDRKKGQGEDRALGIELFRTRLLNDGNDDHLDLGNSWRDDEAFVVAVRHDHDTELENERERREERRGVSE